MTAAAIRTCYKNMSKNGVSAAYTQKRNKKRGQHMLCFNYEAKKWVEFQEKTVLQKKTILLKILNFILKEQNLENYFILVVRKLMKL